MRTIRIKAKVGKDRKLTVSLPEDIAPGEHSIVMVIEDGVQAKDAAPTLFFPSHAGVVDPKKTYRREDIYDDAT